MLGTHEAATNIAVKDLAAARKFYEGTLGLMPVDSEWEELVAFKSGSSTIFVYRSDFAGTNQATAMTWAAGDDFEAEVKALKAKGVQFEHYDMPDTTLDGDVHVTGDMKIAWFKDPDGNILSLTN